MAEKPSGKRDTFVGLVVIAVIVAGAWWLLASCESDESASAQDASSSAAMTTTSTDNEQTFLAAVHGQGVQNDDEQLLVDGRVACTVLYGGSTVEMVIAELTQPPYHYSPTDAGFLVGASVAAFCPDLRSKLPS